MRKRRKVATPKGEPDFVALVTADHMRWYLAECRYEDMTDQQIGEHLGLSAGFVGMVLKGTRPPSRAFLDAAGFEKVTLYRMKSIRTRSGYVVNVASAGSECPAAATGAAESDWRSHCATGEELC